MEVIHSENLTTILFEINKNGISVITLNRPKDMNKFSTKMSLEIISVINQCSLDDRVKAIIVYGGKGDIFCAGKDMAPEADIHSRGLTFADPAGQISLAFVNCKKPVIGAINGHAVGVGITMCVAMDIRVVSEDAKIAFPFARRAISVEAANSVLLPRLVGLTKSNYWLLTGRTFLAKDEKDSGLFTFVVPKGKVFDKALEIATEIIETNSPLSLAFIKELTYNQNNDIERAHANESYALGKCFQSSDVVEGGVSFFEKRNPKFKSTIPKSFENVKPFVEKKFQPNSKL